MLKDAVGTEVGRELVMRGAPPDRPEPKGLGPADIAGRIVADHEGVARRHTRKFQRPPIDLRMGLLPPGIVRAHDPVDSVGESGPFPIPQHLGVAPRQGVRDQHDAKGLGLAPAHGLRSSRHRCRHAVDGSRERRAETIDLDIARDPLNGEPRLVPAVRLLPVTLALGGPKIRRDERVVPVPFAERFDEVAPDDRMQLVGGQPVLDQGVPDIKERSAYTHANIVSMMLDFDQLAFIEKWRQRASRGVVIALDGTSGDIVVTLRSGELGERLDLRGRDATGAVRKARLAIGDRITMAIEYLAKDPAAGSGSSVTGGLVAPGAVVEGTVSATGDITVVDCGAALLVRGETLPANVGDIVRFTIAEEGKAYLIPTR